MNKRLRKLIHKKYDTITINECNTSKKCCGCHNDLEYELYHLVLENNNVESHYGILYVSDGVLVLSESCSEKVFKKYIKAFNL